MNKSIKLGKHFQEAAEKAEERREKLSEEHEKLRKSIDLNTKAEAANRITDCTQELEKKLKQMLPDYYNVSCHDITSYEFTVPNKNFGQNLDYSIHYGNI